MKLCCAFPEIKELKTAWNVSKYGVFSGSYFPTSGLNTERYEVSLLIQSECGKIRTRKNSVFWHFARSERSNSTVWFDLKPNGKSNIFYAQHKPIDINKSLWHLLRDSELPNLTVAFVYRFFRVKKIWSFEKENNEFLQCKHTIVFLKMTKVYDINALFWK